MDFLKFSLYVPFPFLSCFLTWYEGLGSEPGRGSVLVSRCEVVEDGEEEGRGRARRGGPGGAR